MPYRNAHITSLTILLVLLSAIFVAPMAQAQAPDRGPGPNEQSSDQGHSSGGDSDNASTPGASVSGYVYNEGLKPQSGVEVVIAGGGWEAKTVSDSNGFYKFAGLGQDRATVNLTLPADKEPVLPDWPVVLTSGADFEVNLGYMSGDISHLPVLLSGQVENNRLKVQVENRVGELATNGVIEVKLPPGIKSNGNIQANSGEVKPGANSVKVNVSSIEPGEIVDLNMELAELSVQQPHLSDGISVIFTYDQQIMPQLVTLPAELSFEQSVTSETPAANIEQPLPVTGDVETHTNGSLVFVTISGFVIALLLMAGGLSFAFNRKYRP